MKLKAATLILALSLTAAVPPVNAAPGCDARSGPNTAALVELYTSEGCSSCPPADRALSRLVDELGGTAVVPLALHVGYWDSLGWRDRFAQDRFAQRQTWRGQIQGRRNVHTPQFFVAGKEIPPGAAGLGDAVRRINARPAATTIHLHGAISADHLLTLVAEATAPTAGDAAALYLAIAENGLETRVMAGENRGATLGHDHVAREWLGPFPLQGGGTQVRRELRLPAAWRFDRLELVAFVEDQRLGTVLQALRAVCTGQ